MDLKQPKAATAAIGQQNTQFDSTSPPPRERLPPKPLDPKAFFTTLRGFVLSISPNATILIMSWAAETPPQALVRFAVLSGSVSAFGICVTIFRHLNARVESLGTLCDRVHECAHEEADQAKKSKFRRQAKQLRMQIDQDKFDREVHQFWLVLTGMAMFGVATSYVTTTANSFATKTSNLLSTQSVVDPVDLMLPPSSCCILCLASMALAFCLLYDYHRYSLWFKELLGSIPVEVFSIPD